MTSFNLPLFDNSIWRSFKRHPNIESLPHLAQLRIFTTSTQYNVDYAYKKLTTNPLTIANKLAEWGWVNNQYEESLHDFSTYICTNVCTQLHKGADIIKHMNMQTHKCIDTRPQMQTCGHVHTGIKRHSETHIYWWMK